MKKILGLLLLALLQASCTLGPNAVAKKCNAKPNSQILNSAQKQALSDLQTRSSAQCANKEMQCEYIVSEADGKIRVYGYYAKVDLSSTNCATVSMDFDAHEYDTNGKHVKQLPLIST